MTIRRRDEFPDLDEMLSEASRRPTRVLDYRGTDGDAAERDITPALKRLVFAGGMAALFGGLGYAIADNSTQRDGAMWMAVGAAAVALVIPVPGLRRRGGGGDRRE
jgi:hypothetical protein